LIKLFDEEKKNEETTKTEEEVATEEIVEPEPEPVTEEPVEEVHHQKEELGKTEELDTGSLRKKKPWWKFW
jgi:hypothetical protein